MATRHHCPSRVTARCTSAAGKPKTKRCRACGSDWITITGTYGVFVWTGTGRYPLSEAVRTFATEAAAERFTAQDERYVVRFIVGGE